MHSYGENGLAMAFLTDAVRNPSLFIEMSEVLLRKILLNERAVKS